MRNFCLIVFLFAFQLFTEVKAQNFNTAKIVTVNGEKFILHQVVPGETIVSLCKKYKVEQKDLIGANPKLIFGLQAGEQINIPFDSNSKQEKQETIVVPEAVDFIYHVVKKSESVYAIAKQYNVSINSIYHFNPEAEGEVLENEIIRIAKNYEPKAVDGLIREDAEFYYHKIQPKENAYALARRYMVNVEAILDANTTVHDNFEIGTIIRVPKNKAAQNESQQTINSSEFFLHRVEAGDTFYTYQRKFGVSKQQLIDLNPELNDGLQAGLTIKIPTGDIVKVDVIPVNSNDFISHMVTKGESLYSISRSFSISVLEIKELNPELKLRGLVAGETIYLPKKQLIIENSSSNNVELQKVPEVIFDVKKDSPPVIKKKIQTNDDTFRIALFLPLFFDKNDSFNLVKRSDDEIAWLKTELKANTVNLKKYFEIETDTMGAVIDTVLIDSLKVKEVRSVYPPSKPFLEFYEGFWLALDSMQQCGVKIRLNLFDTQFSDQVISKLMRKNNLINADLIIGPVDVHLQKSISDFAYKNQIPFVSPLSSNDELLRNNPFYYQVNPTKDYILRKTADFISDAYYNKNFIIMTLGSKNGLKENNLVNLVRDKFFSFGVYNNIDEVRFTEVDFSEGGNLGYWQVKKTLKPNMENVIFIPATDNIDEREAMLSRAINSLHVLAEEYPITLVGVSDYPRFTSISTEYYHQLELSFLTPYRIDYNSRAVNNFIKKFRENYVDEPKEYSYSFRGYDIGLYFTSAYRQFGENFTDYIGGFKCDGLLQSDFNFQRVDAHSGFMNHTLYIMQYDKDYNINVISKVTEGRLLIDRK